MRFERVVVTGGGGLLGRFVVDELMDICALSVLDIAPPRQDVPYFETDILDLDGVRAALAGQEAVVHLAGIDDGNAPRDKDYIETNVQGAWNVFHAAEEAGLRKLVVASSIATLGIGRERMPDYLPADEGHPLRTTGTYGLSKEVIETLARHFVRRGRLDIVCLRPTLIVRPEREAAILAQLELADPDGDPPDGALGAGGAAPYGALSATRTYVRSKDAARCFRMALDHDGAGFDVFNVSAVDSIGREETLKRLEAVYGRLPAIRDPALYASDPYASVLDISRTRGELGWAPEGDWTSVVAEHRR
ncbi:MAG: NAD(P)-dependent oxidoreductase [Proteobacteria bacterium]|nr:NAD(P)-dependent oxidoreductase [Pseudomonadota bacterium]